MLSLNLLGQVAITRDGVPISRFRSQAEIALLAYLAHTGQPHGRAVVADLLWDARSTGQSLSNLRTVLSRLREDAGDELIITRKTVALRPETRRNVDSARLQLELQTIGRPYSPEEAARLAAALQRYHGDFLAGFYLAGAPRFNEWVVVEQERLRQLVFSSLENLIGYALQSPNPPLGIEAARQCLAIDELNETAHARLITFLALSGRTNAALTHYDQLVKLLDTELGLVPQRSTAALMERIRKGELTAAPPHAPRERYAIHHNLPRELTPFVGRATERAALVERLLDPSFPLVTLTGEGGMGKTRLALAAAGDVVATDEAGAEPIFRDGVWFVPLATVDGHALAREAVAAAIGAAMRLYFHGERQPSDQLLALLQGKSCLIVLDNFEHLLAGDSPDLVIDLLRAAPGVQLLATSRAPLEMNSEYVVRLAGLPVPQDPSRPAGEIGLTREPDATEYDSVRLFAERAARTGEPFHLTECAADVIAICRYLDGMPLGIELAAAGLSRMSCAEIAAGIAANIDFLATERRDVPKRQRNMRAVFNYSWDLLTPAARQALARASVFRGGFGPEAAAAVIGPTTGQMDVLVKHSLLERDASGRYAMHELLREFAAGKMAQEGNNDHAAESAENRVRERHGTYYLNLVGKVTPIGERAEVTAAAALTDIDNIRQAWRWAADGTTVDGQSRPHSADLAVALDGLLIFYARRSLFREGEESFGNALAALQTDSPAAPETQWIQARLLVARATLLNTLNRYEEAVTLAKEVIDFADTHQDSLLLARGCLQWGTALYRQGHYDDALALLNRGLTAAITAGLGSIEADIRRRIGTSLLEKGAVDTARRELEQALLIYRQSGIRIGEGDVLNDLGWLEQRAMNLDVARVRLTAGIAIQRELDVQHGVTMGLINLSAVVEMLGNYDEAHALRLEALDILETIDDRYHRSLVNHGIGLQLSRLGNYDGARMYYERSIAIDREVGNAAGVAWTNNNLGLLYNHLGQYETALALHQESLQTARELGARTAEGLALSRIGQDMYGLGRLEESRAALEAAAGIQHEMHQRVWEIESNAGLANTCLDLGQKEQALALVELILPKLDDRALHGAREPFRVCWNCYRVLAAMDDIRATSVLAAACADLRHQADTIQNEALRRSYLENVPVHRFILSTSHEPYVQ